MTRVEMRGICDLIEYERVLVIVHFRKYAQDPEYD
jgi:hypothetical protein